MFMGDDVNGHVENIQTNRLYWKKLSEMTVTPAPIVKQESVLNTKGSTSSR